MPFPLASALREDLGRLVLAAGRDDDDRGLRIGYRSEFYPRICITPDGAILTGDGQSEPATPFHGEAVGSVIHLASPTTPRPEGYAIVIWLGTVEPDNAEDYDLYIPLA